MADGKNPGPFSTTKEALVIVRLRRTIHQWAVPKDMAALSTYTKPNGDPIVLRAGEAQIMDGFRATHEGSHVRFDRIPDIAITDADLWPPTVTLEPDRAFMLFTREAGLSSNGWIIFNSVEQATAYWR